MEVRSTRNKPAVKGKKEIWIHEIEYRMTQDGPIVHKEPLQFEDINLNTPHEVHINPKYPFFCYRMTRQ